LVYRRLVRKQEWKRVNN